MARFTKINNEWLVTGVVFPLHNGCSVVERKGSDPAVVEILAPAPDMGENLLFRFRNLKRNEVKGCYAFLCASTLQGLLPPPHSFQDDPDLDMMQEKYRQESEPLDVVDDDLDKAISNQLDQDEYDHFYYDYPTFFGDD